MMTHDNLLLERWQHKRDADAFTELVQRYAPLVYAACVRVLRDASLAEDVAQDCFLELLQSSSRAHVSMAAWLHTLAVRRSLDRIKANTRRRGREQDYGAALPAQQPAEDAALTEVLAQVDAAIAALPEAQRNLMVARFLDGQTHSQLAVKAGVAEPTVRYRLDKAIEATREQLRRRGIVVATATLVAGLEGAAQPAPVGLLQRLSKLAVSNTLPPVTAMISMTPLLLKGAVALCVAGLVVVGGWLLPPQPSVTSASAPAPANATASVTAVTAPAPAPRTDAPPAKDPAAEAATPLIALPADQTPFSVRGRILDASTLEGIAGVSIEVFPTGGGRISATSEATDAQGDYLIPPIPAGAYTLRLRSVPAYPAAMGEDSKSLTLAEDAPISDFDFALKRGIPVSGSVVTPAGDPVKDATVGALATGVYNPITATTNADGGFVLYMTGPASDLMLQARADSGESGPLERLRLEEGGLANQQLVLDRPRTAMVSGTVMDGSGAPVIRAHVYLRHKDPAVFTSGGEQQAGEDGTFEFKNCGPGDYSIIVTPPEANGYSTSEEYARVTLEPGQIITGLEIVYGEKGGHAVAGRVVNSTGEAVSGATITHYAEQMQRAYTDQLGNFTLTGLKEGQCVLGVEHIEYSSAQVSAEAGTLDLEIVLKGHGTLAGHVVQEGKGTPIPAFSLACMMGEVQRLDPLFENGRTFESADGSFNMGKLSAGPVAVAAWAPGFAPAWKNITLEEAQTTEVILTLSPVPEYHGVVVNAAGDPVAEAIVYFVEQVDLDRMERVAAAHTDVEGNFTITSLPPDKKRVCAYHRDYGVGVLDLPGNGRIVLPAGATIEGKVSFSEGAATDYFVNAYYPAASHLPQRYDKLAADGTFRMEHVSPGVMKLGVRFASGPSVSQSLTIANGQTYQPEFVFNTGTAIVTGTLTAEGEVVASANLEIAHGAGAITESMGSRPDSNGRFRFENVWAGTLTLRVTRWSPDPPHETTEDEFEIEMLEGETRELELELPATPW